MPKTGTTSLVSWIKSNLSDYEFVLGDCSYHGVQPPSPYPVWVTYRNPYDRLVSLWHYYGRYCLERGLGVLPFAEWAPQAIEGHQGIFHQRTTVDWLNGSEVAGIIKFPRMDQQLSKLFKVPVVLPTENKAQRRPWTEYYTRELMQVVRPWASVDTERFVKLDAG